MPVLTEVACYIQWYYLHEVLYGLEKAPLYRDYENRKLLCEKTIPYWCCSQFYFVTLFHRLHDTFFNFNNHTYHSLPGKSLKQRYLINYVPVSRSIIYIMLFSRSYSRWQAPRPEPSKRLKEFRKQKRMILIKKSNLHYIRDITRRRVTSGPVHLRG